MIRRRFRQAWQGSRGIIDRGQDWARRNLPPGVRLIVGVFLIIGGVLAFLPVLGIWMLPLGVAIAALDVKPLVRWLRGRRD